MGKTVKKNVRFDSHRVRLRTGETEKPYGYEYRWTTPDGCVIRPLHLRWIS